MVLVPHEVQLCARSIGREEDHLPHGGRGRSAESGRGRGRDPSETDDATFIAAKSGTVSKNLTLVPLDKATVGRDYIPRSTTP